MEDCKPWWASRAIWAGVIGSLWGVAAALDILLEGLTQADVLTVVLALTGSVDAVLRFFVFGPPRLPHLAQPFRLRLRCRAATRFSARRLQPSWKTRNFGVEIPLATLCYAIDKSRPG